MDSLTMRQVVVTLYSARMVLELEKRVQMTSISIQLVTSVINLEISIHHALIQLLVIKAMDLRFQSHHMLLVESDYLIKECQGFKKYIK